MRTSTQCNSVAQIGIIVIIAVVLVTAFWKRYRTRQQALPTAVPVEDGNAATNSQGYSRVDVHDEESNTNKPSSSGGRPFIESYPARAIEMVAPVSQVVNHF